MSETCYVMKWKPYASDVPVVEFFPNYAAVEAATAAVKAMRAGYEVETGEVPDFDNYYKPAPGE